MLRKLASSSREDWDLLRGDGDSFRADRDSIRGGRDSFRETRDSFREERGTRVPFGRGGRINPSRTREQNQQVDYICCHFFKSKIRNYV